MNKLARSLSARFDAAESRVKAAEAEVRRASKSRLADLLKLPVKQRFQQLEDPVLTPQDRLKLRRSIEASLPRGRSFRIPFARQGLLRRSKQWLRSTPRLAVTIVAGSVPGLFVALAGKNTYQTTLLTEPLPLEWTLPNGSHELKAMLAGGNLAVRPVDSTSAVARRWIPGKGYATAPVFW